MSEVPMAVDIVEDGLDSNDNQTIQNSNSENNTNSSTDNNNNSSNNNNINNQSNGVNTITEEDGDEAIAIVDSPTQYEKLCSELLDERCTKDFTLGKRIGFYRIRNDIGSGNFAKVKLGFHCLVKERVAIKILDKTKLDEKTLRLLSQEIASMERILHPVVVRIFEVLETLSHVYIVTEYATSGELFHKIISDGKLSEPTAKKYYSQILSGVSHMHQNKIIHRDIKAENVFLSGSQCKIGDFGFSTIVNDPDQHLNTFCGSPPYAAPELFKDDYYIGRYVDIWALGILLYFMTTGVMPFRADTVGKLKRKILEGVYTIPDHVSSSLRNLIINVIRLLASDRFTMVQMMSCDWLEGVTYPKANTSFSLKPSLKGDDDEELSEAENTALRQLRSFGISDEMMLDCPSHSRDSITGTYRVALYQAERREEEEKGKGLGQANRQDDVDMLEEKKLDMKRTSTRSKFCVLI